MLMKLWPGYWKNNLEGINMKVNEDNGKYVGMVRGWARKFWRFSGNKFWNNIGCFISDHTLGFGGFKLWEEEEEQKTIGNKSKRF